MAYVSYRLKFRPRRRDSCKELPQVIDRMVQELLHFKPTGEDKTAADLQADYTDKLLRVFASQLSDFQEGLVDYYNSWTTSWTAPRTASRIARLAEKYSSDKAIVDVDMFGPAAAVGNMEALKHYLPHPDDWCGWNVLLSPWSAAIINGQVEAIKLLLDRDRPFAPVEPEGHIPTYLYVKFQEATRHHKVDIAKFFIDYFLDRDYLGRYDGINTIGLAMKYGSIEVFEYLHKRLSNIEDHLSDYYDILCMGLTQACENGHSDFVRYFLQFKNAPPIFWIEDTYIIWNSYSGCDHYYVKDPVFAAASVSQVAVLDVLIDYSPNILQYKRLLEIAVLGFNWHDYAYSGSEEQDPCWMEWHRKRGSSYAVAQLLIKRGIPITGATITFTNFFAKVICMRPKLRSDFAMTLILLLVTLKKRFDHRSLRKQIHVPVRKALLEIVEKRPDMRAVGLQQYDFLGVAQELIDWLYKHR